MTEQSSIPVEAQAVPDLHQQIMNLPCKLDPILPGDRVGYKIGHRDARHAAAQLVAASPAVPTVPLADYQALQRLVTSQGIRLMDAEDAASPAAAAGVPPEALQKIRELRDAQGQHGNWNVDQYMQGLYNGIELALATAEGRDPEFRSKPAEGWIGWGSPVAPVGAPTRLTDEQIIEEAKRQGLWIVTGMGNDHERFITSAGQQVIATVRALLSRQGCELATDATKQLMEPSVHLPESDA